MILKVHVPGAPCYDVGDEIWPQSLTDAIAAEAGGDRRLRHGRAASVETHGGSHCPADRIIAEMTAALGRAGDRYTAPDGVVYSLLNGAQQIHGRAEVR